MDSTTSKTAFYYYSGVFILAILVCSALIGFLKWPLLAEIPLAVCIFIQVIAISRSAHKYWDRIEGRELFAYLFAKSKAQLLHLETHEEEANI